jgi:hypothetical protein
MPDLGARSRKMVSLYSCDAEQALAMVTASEKISARIVPVYKGWSSSSVFLSVFVLIYLSPRKKVA